MSPKVAIVTGSNKGIGLAIVKGLCKRFDGVVYLTSRDVKRGEQAVAELNKEGLKPNYHQLDITDKTSLEKFRDYLKAKYEGIDLLVNNAAIAFKNNAPEPAGVQAEQTLSVNYFAVLSTCEILFPLLKNGARVVNLSSSAGHLSLIPSENLRKKLADPNLTIPELSELMRQYIEAAKQGTHAAEWGDSSYKVSKVGLTAMTKIHQRLLNDRDIKVSVVHPGFIDTGMTSPKGPLTIEETGMIPGKSGTQPYMEMAMGNTKVSHTCTTVAPGPSGVRHVVRAAGKSAGPPTITTAPGRPEVTQQDNFDAPWTLVGSGRQGADPRHSTGGGGPAAGMHAGSTQFGVNQQRKAKLNSKQRRKYKARLLAGASATPTNAAPLTVIGESQPRVRPPGDSAKFSAPILTSEEASSQATQVTEQVAGGGGGRRAQATAKRARLDETKSPRGEAKRPRLGPFPKPQLASYANAVRTNLIAAVTVSDTGTISRVQADLVLGALQERILGDARSNPVGTVGPEFRGKPTLVGSALQVWCADARTLDWLKACIAEMSLPSVGKPAVARPGDLPRRVRCGILIPGVFSTSDIGRALKYQNPWAQVDRWLLHAAKDQRTETFIIVSVPEDVVQKLMEHERRLSFLMGSVYIKFRSQRGNYTETPPELHPFPDEQLTAPGEVPVPGLMEEGRELEATTDSNPPEAVPPLTADSELPRPETLVLSDLEEEDEDAPDGVPLV